MSGFFIGDSMDRQITYPGQLLAETSLLQATKDAMIGMAKLSSALLGTSTVASGFAVTPTGPASLQVLCAPGEIYSLTAIDALAFSTLPADTTHSILKQGIMLDGVTLSCPAPGTTGQSINYLVQVTYQDTDATPVLLPYYNSANPALPYSGMGNNGLPQNTIRKGSAIVAVKAGASATTGTQVTPAPDAGYIGLYVVTVAFGQTTITAGNISVLSTAPLINSTLHGLAPVFQVSPVVPAATAATQAAQFGQMSGVVGQSKNVSLSVTAASASATLAADEIVVETVLGGLRYCLPSFNKVVNLGTAGAGGMDTGTAPVSGFVGLYAIYNPSTGVSALLAANATASVLPAIYGGANMPAGYTASALVSVLPTNASSQFAICQQIDSHVDYTAVTALSTSTVAGSPTTFTTTVFPKNARTVGGSVTVTSTAVSAVTISLYASDSAVGRKINNGTLTASGQQTVPFDKLYIRTPQTIRYECANGSGTPTFVIAISSYDL